MRREASLGTLASTGAIERALQRRDLAERQLGIDGGQCAPKTTYKHDCPHGDVREWQHKLAVWNVKDCGGDSPA
jgi:hypothetical protein